MKSVHLNVKSTLENAINLNCIINDKFPLIANRRVENDEKWQHRLLIILQYQQQPLQHTGRTILKTKQEMNCYVA